MEDNLISGGIWPVASITDEPETKLSSWRVYSVEGVEKDSPRTTHFVGYTGFEGRVCSAIQSFDPKTMRGITASGRIYELVGNSGWNQDASYVWNRWLVINKNPDVIDITDTYQK